VLNTRASASEVNTNRSNESSSPTFSTSDVTKEYEDTAELVGQGEPIQHTV